jgi:hypothetical protein
MPALKITAEYERLESIIVGLEAGCGVAIVYQSTSCVSGKRLTLRSLFMNQWKSYVLACRPDKQMSGRRFEELAGATGLEPAVLRDRQAFQFE